MPVSFIHRLVRRALLATSRSAPDIPEAHLEIIRGVAPFTKTSRDRLAALIAATEYLIKAAIPGAIAECGVWRGGSMMAVAKTLMACGAVRPLYLYDTFEGMTAPTSRDRSILGQSAMEWYRSMQRKGKRWDGVSVEEVRSNLGSTGWPMGGVNFVVGRVEETIPASVPQQLALLRLDTDWYESTLHELTHLYPLLSPGGILIVDDYGHWQGAREAVDEYFASRPVFLHRVDYTARLVVKA